MQVAALKITSNINALIKDLFLISLCNTSSDWMVANIASTNYTIDAVKILMHAETTYRIK
jgi:hypothetical protein